MAKAWGDESHLRGLASWTRLPWVGRRPSAGLAARAPLGTRSGSFSSCLPPDYHVYMCSHLLVYVMCLYHSPTARRPWSRCATISRGLAAGAGPDCAPLATGAICCCAFLGLIHRYIVCLFAPQPRGVDFDAWASFYFMRRGYIAGSARICGPRLAPAGAGSCAVAYMLTGKVGVATQWSVDAIR